MTHPIPKPRKFTKTHGETIRTITACLTIILQLVILIKVS
jgi:hypothetical protein